jgi:hypothetical protein
MRRRDSGDHSLMPYINQISIKIQSWNTMNGNIILAGKIQQSFQTIGPRTFKNGYRLNLASPCAERLFHGVDPVNQVRVAALIAFGRAT